MEEHQGNVKEGRPAQKNTKEKKQTVTQTQRPHYDPNNQGASHSLQVQKALERIRTAKQNASVNVREQQKDCCENHLDDKTKTQKQKQRARECQTPGETTSEYLTEFKEEHGEDIVPADLKGEKEPKRNVTPLQRRHHGLYNQGATCYLNSVLQVLFMTTEIHDRLNQQPDQELREIFTDLKTQTCGTENITKSLKIENVHEKRDAAECLQEILHHISKEASELFRGQLRHTTKCSKGHIINEETKTSWTLPLSLKDTNDSTYSVESSFKRTFQPKKYSSGNMMYCNDCKQKTGATSRWEMVKAPQILILHLKRFDFNSNTRSHFKSDCCVEVPCELQLKNKTYKLYGMVNHMGSLRGGHYTATVLSEDSTWYECNDSHVSKIKHHLFAEDRTFRSRTVFLLTYKATESEMFCETRQHEKDEVQTRNDNELFNYQTEGKEDNTEENLNNNPEGLKQTDRGLGKFKNWFNSFKSKTKSSPSKSTRCQKPVETASEILTDEVKEEQGDNIGAEEPKKHKEPKRNREIKTDDKETTQMGHSANDEGKTRKDRKKERLQARGVEGDEENVETDTSFNNNITTGSEVTRLEEEETQENKDSNTRKNSKSEELNATLVVDASVNVVEQPKDSCEQHLNEETKTEKQKQRVTPPQRRHHGLYNQGATCYLNSVLQVLFMTTEIHDRLNQQPDQELREIFTDLKRKTCRTENITRCLKIENVHEQRDAAECLQEILHHISPEASEVFQGQLMDTTMCSKGHIINEEINPFWTLPLSLKDSNDTTYSVESSFERTFQTKKYSSGNMMYCNDCKQKTGATSRCEMVEAPQILILHLKRFNFDYTIRSHFKSHCCVEVPCELQLKNKTYKLYGMVNHMGSLRGGHYTATVLSEDNTWYEFSDSHVSKTKHHAEDRTFRSRTVYLLTYRATELEMSYETRQHEEDEVQTRNDNELFNKQTEGEEDNTEGNLNNKPEEMNKTKSKNSCEHRLGKETKFGSLKNFLISVLPKKTFSPSQATECQKPVETTSENLTDEVKEKQGEDIGPEEPKEHKEPKRNREIKTDDEETTQMGHCAESEGKMRKDKKKEILKARGEEGDAENVETDTSINNHTTVSKVKSSEDEEAQEIKDSNTRENRKSEELNATLV